MRVCFVFLFGVLSLSANPKLSEIIKGDVQIDVNNEAIHIIAPDQSIIHWQDFSIGESEFVKFIQPHIEASVLNRVVGPNLSSILGKLEANGQILLINPNGIFVGDKAVIQTGSFITSTLDLLDEDYIKSKELLFKGDSDEAIRNLGQIIAETGDAILISTKIDNQGEIKAKKGTAALGVSKEVLVLPQNEKRLAVRPFFRDGEIGLDQSGLIEAVQVEISVHGNPYELAVQQSGTIKAQGIEERDGKVLLVAKGGTAFLKGEISSCNYNETGGDIHILGEKIALLDEAMIDASGKFGGGTILIGGDQNGTNPLIPNAEFVFVEKGVNVLSHATENGDAGNIIFWADNTTRMYALANASGGPEGGNGGLIEISGKMGFDYRGVALRLAPKGEVGTLLLDPSDVLVSPGPGPTVDGTFAGGIFTPTVDPATLFIGPGAMTLITELAGGNLTIRTTPGGVSPGDITILGSITTGSANILTFDAASDFFMGAPSPPSTITHNGILNIIAARDINFGDGTRFSGALFTLNLNAGRNINMLSGAVNGGILILGTPLSMSATATNMSLSASAGDFPLIYGHSVPPSMTNFAINLTGNLTLSAAGAGVQTAINALETPNSSINVGGNLVMTADMFSISTFLASMAAPSFINVGGDIIGTVTNAGLVDLVLNFPFAGGSGGMVTAGGDIFFDGPGARILTSGPSAPGKTIGIEAQNVTFQNNSTAQLLSGDVDVLANDSMNVLTGAFISTGISNQVNLVVDNAFPTPPGVGGGAFTLDAASSLIVGFNAELRIFTAIRSQNTVDGFIAGAPFVPGPFGVNTAQEIWSIYYPSILGSGNPVTFFYKEPSIFLNPVIGPVIAASKVAQVEALTDLLEFDEIIEMYIRYEADMEVLFRRRDVLLDRIHFFMRTRNFGTNLTKQIGPVLPK